MTKSKLGDVFGRLTIFASKPPVNGRKAWDCDCVCGEARTVLDKNLRSGATTSCGCLRNTNFGSLSHGMSRHPAYAAYMSMVARCKTFERTPRKRNKKLGEFFDASRAPKIRYPTWRKTRKDADPNSDTATAADPLAGYVPRPVPIWPDVSTFELFWAALGPSWFPGAKLVRLSPQPAAPDPTMDAMSAMRADNLKWVPK